MREMPEDTGEMYDNMKAVMRTALGKKEAPWMRLQRERDEAREALRMILDENVNHPDAAKEMKRIAREALGT